MRPQFEPAVSELAHERDRTCGAAILEPALRQGAPPLEHPLRHGSVADRAPLLLLREDLLDERAPAAQRAPLRPQQRADRAPCLPIASLVAIDDSLRVGAEPRNRCGAMHRNASERVAASS